jgi:hypothetical protein
MLTRRACLRNSISVISLGIKILNVQQPQKIILLEVKQKNNDGSDGEPNNGVISSISIAIMNMKVEQRLMVFQIKEFSNLIYFVY